MKKIVYLAPLALLGIGTKVSANQVSTHISNALRIYEQESNQNQSVGQIADKQTEQTGSTFSNDQINGQPLGKREEQQSKESASNLPNGQNDEQLNSFAKKSVETIQPVMPKKQVLATHISMLDKHQANQLNVQFSSNTNIDYRESKSEIPNNNWADPVNNGYHKTSVGWVYDKSNYPNLAKTSSVVLTGDEGDITNITPNIDAPYWYHTHIKATVDKNMISHAAGKTILLGSIAVLNQDQRFNEIDINSDSNFFIKSNNQTIGYITSDGYSTYDYPSSHIITGYPDGQNFHALYFVLHVTSDLNFADDLKINSQGPDILFNEWNTQYYGLRGTTKDNPLHTKLITNNQTYNITTCNTDHNPIVDPWTNSNLSDEQGRELDLSYWLNNNIELASPEFTRDPNSKFANRDYHSVYQVSSLPNDDGSVNQLVIDNIAANSRARLDVPTNDGWHLVNAWSPVNRDTQFEFKKLTNNLSSQQVYDAANQSNSGAYSVQNDGSVIISTNFNPTTFFKLGSQSLKAFKASVLNSYAYNIWCKNDTERQNLLNNLQKQLEKSNYQAMDTKIEIFGLALQHPDQVGHVALTNLTPDMANTTKVTLYTPKGTSLSSSQYQQINLKFVDDDNHEKVISTKPIFEGNGHDLYISFDKKITVPNGAKLQQIALPVGITLNNNQSDLNNYNADTKVFHYGTVELTNPDVIIHVRHQIKHVDNPSISDLRLNATKNIHLVNSNKTAPTGQTVSWGVKYTKDLYTSLVTADLNSKKALTDPNDFKNDIHVPSLDGYSMIHSNLSYLQL